MVTYSRTTGAHLFAPVFSCVEKYLKHKKINPINFQGWDNFNEVLQIVEQDFQEWTGIRIGNGQYADKIYTKACQTVLFRFLIVHTNLYAKFIKAEEYEKVLQLYQRKQLNSKLLQELLIGFSKFYHYCRQDLSQYFKNIFTLPLLEEIEAQSIEEVNIAFTPLKKVIEKVASGVVADCYLQAQNKMLASLYYSELDETLQNYIKEKYNYTLKAYFLIQPKMHFYLFTINEIHVLFNTILQNSLLKDAVFWEKNQNFDIVKFINIVYEKNSFKHAIKIVDFIFTNLVNIPEYKLMIENNLPLAFAEKEKVIEAYNERTRIMFARLLQTEKDKAILAKEDFCYPLVQAEGIKEKLNIGKDICKQFLQVYLYPHAYDKVKVLLLQEIDSVTNSTYLNKELHSGFLLDNNLGFFSLDRTLGYIESGDRLVIKAYCPNSFSTENILNRVFLKAYVAKKCIQDDNKTYQFLHKIYLQSIEHFAKKYAIFTAQQIDTSKREECYVKLKNILKEFDIEPQEKNKAYYITALLDRDIAMLQEIENFAMLEQLGDAIYNFVVADLLFYNPNTNSYTKSFANKYNLYIQAQMQVQICKKYKFDTAFFALEWIEQTAQKEKYLADSLEMIIGAICLDLGAKGAIQFVQKMLQESFSDDFKEPLYFSKCIDMQGLENEYEEYIDYLDIITPKSFTRATSFNDILNSYELICNIVQKALFAITIGTDTIRKRELLTYSDCYDLKLFNIKENSWQNWLLYYYLKDGLLPTVERYKDIVLANFKEQKKEV